MSAEGKREEAKLSEYLGIGGLDDEEAQALAEKVVREARRELGREAPPEETAPESRGGAPKSGFDAITPPEFVERENL